MVYMSAACPEIGSAAAFEPRLVRDLATSDATEGRGGGPMGLECWHGLEISVQMPSVFDTIALGDGYGLS